MLPLDLSNQKFGRLKAIEITSKRRNNKVVWKCICNCKNKSIVYITSGDLRSGHTKSCGCLHKELLIKAKTTHGKSKTAEYICRKDMLARCYNTKHKAYKNYGKRGITVCKRWRNAKTGLQNFINDMGKRPTGKTLERINNNIKYTPTNCVWKSRRTQANNRRTNILVTMNGKTKTISQWCRKLNIPYVLVNNYRLRGVSSKKAIRKAMKLKAK
jgi:hypothetical protein